MPGTASRSCYGSTRNEIDGEEIANRSIDEALAGQPGGPVMQRRAEHVAGDR